MENATHTVLVVDDDEVVRFYLSAILRENGYEVLQAVDGAKAIDIMRDKGKEIAVVLSDIHMPNIDGLKLAELNYQNGFLPFIACTMISEAATALKLLRFGVRDYVVKPVESAVLLNTVRNAIERRKLPRLFADDETPVPGNIGSITISSTFAAIHRATGWLEIKASGIMTPAEQRKFINFASEFLMNAYEHGSLRVTEEEKTALIESGAYHDELRRRELECKLKIEVAVSIVGNEIALNITDAGYGFDYRRYLEMTEAEMLDRLILPNGRGVQMASQYFDSIIFSKGGASVLLLKKIVRA